ncbi:MAG: hypothetical protein WBX81_01660 [Nitrososphaeraceae archaeon]|jgi:hypothetical protein
MPNNPIIYGGTISGIREPSALIPISRPIPKYWPNTTYLTGNIEEEKNIIIRKI